MIQKVIRKLLGRKPVSTPPLHNDPVVFAPAESFFLEGSSTDFRNGKEPRKYITVGSKCIIGALFTFETPSGEVLIGNNVHLGRVHFICKTKIEIEDDVTMAWGITLYDHDSHSVNWEYRKNDNHQCYRDYINNQGNNIANKDWSHVNTKAIKICSKVWIGFDVLVLKGVTIGEGAVVAAKSVVTKDVPAWTLVAGNPAKVVKHLEKPV